MPDRLPTKGYNRYVIRRMPADSLLPRTTLLTLLVTWVLAFSVLVGGQPREPQTSVFFWEPSIEDVSRDETSTRRIVLKFLLKSAVSIHYHVKLADNLDKIIRTQFFVYRKNQPNAYSLYLEEILKRNERKLALRFGKNYLLFPGEKLVLPSGPKYAALELDTMSSKKDDAKYRVRAAMGFGTDRRLTENELNGRLLKNFGYFAETKNPAEISSRRIAYPVNAEKFPSESYGNYEAVEFVASPDVIPVPVKHGSFQGLLPAITNQDVDCGKCTLVRDVLEYLEKGNDATRLFIADTGLARDVNAPRTQLFYPASSRVGACDDLASKQHGTFVYSETARGADLYGVLPPSKVYIAKWAVPFPQHEADEEPYKFRLKELYIAIRNINQTLTVQEPTTVVVNISASGPAGPGESIPPLVQSNRLLFVAAAGNEHSNAIPDKNLFAQQNKMAANILIVGALDEKGESRAAYSNYHPTNVDLFVQGSCICGRGKDKEQLNGTSQASPIISVAAAILAGVHPNWSPIDVKWRLISTSTYSESLANEAASVGWILNSKRATKSGIIVVLNPDANVGVDNSSEREFEVAELHFDNNWRNDWQKLFVNEMSAREVLRLRRIACSPQTKEGISCFKRMTLGMTPDTFGIEISSAADLTLISASGSMSIKAGQIVDLILPILASPRDGKIVAAQD